MEKPLTIRREELAAELATVINKAQIPAFIIKPIIWEIAEQLAVIEKQQYEQDKKIYEEKLKEEADANEQSV